MATLITRLKDKDCIKVTEEILKEYKYIKLGLKTLREQLELIDEDIISLPAVGCSERVQMSLSGSPTEDSALEIIECKKFIEKKIEEDKKLIRAVDRGLNNLDLIHRQVLEHIVINGDSWVYTCDKLKYGETQLREKKKEAVKSMAYALFGFSIVKEDTLFDRLEKTEE